MLKGITEVAKAWQILEKYYGNRHVTINTVITGLRNCTLTGTTSQASVPLPASPPGLHIPPTGTCLAVPSCSLQCQAFRGSHVTGLSSAWPTNSPSLASWRESYPPCAWTSGMNFLPTLAGRSPGHWLRLAGQGKGNGHRSLYKRVWHRAGLPSTKGRGVLPQNHHCGGSAEAGRQEQVHSQRRDSAAKGLVAGSPRIHREATEEEEEVRARERAKPCPLCKGEGRPGQVHSCKRSFQ